VTVCGDPADCGTASVTLSYSRRADAYWSPSAPLDQPSRSARDMSDPFVAAPLVSAPVASAPGEDPSPTSTPRTHRPLLRVVLEVALIATGVFLGLLADQWREREQHREAARASLRRFRTEIAANREAVAAVRDYHVATLASLRSYLGKSHEARNVADVKLDGLRWVTFEHTAWDLAIATQSLAYLDSDVAYSLSRIYGVQQSYADLSRGMTQAMYLLPRQDNFDGFAEAADAFFGDVTYMEPKLLVMYDELLPRLDRMLGAPTSKTSAR
jgi:hypothetical protein